MKYLLLFMPFIFTGCYYNPNTQSFHPSLSGSYCSLDLDMAVSCMRTEMNYVYRTKTSHLNYSQQDLYNIGFECGELVNPREKELIATEKKACFNEFTRLILEGTKELLEKLEDRL